MQYDIFNLRPNDEFIELVKLLKIAQIGQTGGHAKMIIEDGLIVVNGEQELRKRRKLRAGDMVEYENMKIKILNHEG
jgi:ribosome-associated protein